jgi:hypothetical protein
MSEFSSVHELARSVANEANRIKTGKAAELNATRVLNRVNEAHAALEALNQVVTAARRLEATSGQESVGQTGLDDGRADFERLAQRLNYLPSNQAFDGAKNRIGSVTKRVAVELTAAWRQWTERETNGVPRLRISQLDAEGQTVARQHLDSLAKAAKVAVPTTTHIVIFQSDLDYLHDLLDPLPDLGSAVQALYERLGQRPTLTLADMTDDQILALRNAGVADQIELRRRGA